MEMYKLRAIPPNLFSMFCFALTALPLLAASLTMTGPALCRNYPLGAVYSNSTKVFSTSSTYVATSSLTADQNCWGSCFEGTTRYKYASIGHDKLKCYCGNSVGTTIPVLADVTTSAWSTAAQCSSACGTASPIVGRRYDFYSYTGATSSGCKCSNTQRSSTYKATAMYMTVFTQNYVPTYNC